MRETLAVCCSQENDGQLFTPLFVTCFSSFVLDNLLSSSSATMDLLGLVSIYYVQLFKSPTILSYKQTFS